jgi:hypothetical protein
MWFRSCWNAENILLPIRLSTGTRPTSYYRLCACFDRREKSPDCVDSPGLPVFRISGIRRSSGLQFPNFLEGELCPENNHPAGSARTLRSFWLKPRNFRVHSGGVNAEAPEICQSRKRTCMKTPCSCPPPSFLLLYPCCFPNAFAMSRLPTRNP